MSIICFRPQFYLFSQFCICWILIRRFLHQSLCFQCRSHSVFCICMFFCLHVRSKWPFFPQLLHVWSNAGHSCVRFQFGALQNLQGLLLLNLSRSCVDFVYSIISSSLVAFFRFDINASGIVFSFLLLVCVLLDHFYRFLHLRFFSFVSRSRSFLLVIAVKNFEMSNFSAVIFSK